VGGAKPKPPHSTVLACRRLYKKFLLMCGSRLESDFWFLSARALCSRSLLCLSALSLCSCSLLALSAHPHSSPSQLSLSDP